VAAGSEEGLPGDLLLDGDELAQRQREREAAEIQLAREQALAEEREREAAERHRAEREAREAELARLTLWTDTHCHLQYGEDDEATLATVNRALAAGVRRMVCVGTDAESSRAALDIAVRQSRSGTLVLEVYATAGLHPHEAASGLGDVKELIAETLRDPVRSTRLVAVGECGLDFYYDHAPRHLQRKVFEEQIDLANQYGLTLVIHTREAFDETIECLGSRGVPAKTIFHCFTGGPAEAERCLELGAYLSFSGIATFASAGEVRESAMLCPLDRLLVETDSPYLTPVPFRGKPNEPAYVPLVGEAIAKARSMEPFDLARITSENAVAAFALPSAPLTEFVSA
jgi:TatD DNase family protein